MMMKEHLITSDVHVMQPLYILRGLCELCVHPKNRWGLHFVWGPYMSLDPSLSLN